MIERASFEDQLLEFYPNHSMVEEGTNQKVGEVVKNWKNLHESQREAAPLSGARFEAISKRTWGSRFRWVFNIFGFTSEAQKNRNKEVAPNNLLSMDQNLITSFQPFIENIPDKKKVLVEALLNLQPEVKKAFLLNRLAAVTLLTSRPLSSFSLEALLTCNPINQQFIFSQAGDICEFANRFDLYEDLLVMNEEEVQFASDLIRKGFDLESLFQMKTVLDTSGRPIGFSSIAKGFSEFSKGTLELQQRSPALTDAILMIVFIEFIKGHSDKGLRFRMVANLKPEVKEAILSNEVEVLALLRSKLRGAGSLQRVLSHNPVNQRFVFSYAKDVQSHDEAHHKRFVESIMYELEGVEVFPGDEKVHLCSSMYEELLWIEEEEIYAAEHLIGKGFSPTSLFKMKELMNQHESSISFSEIKKGISAQEGMVLERKFQQQSTEDQLLIILFMEFVENHPDKGSILEKLLNLDQSVKSLIFSNKVGVLDLLRGILSASFTLETVLDANLYNQLLLFSLEGKPYDFISPDFYRDLLAMPRKDVQSICDIVKHQKIEFKDFFQVQIVARELGITIDLFKFGREFIKFSEEDTEIEIHQELVLMVFFIPYIEKNDKRALLRKIAKLDVRIKGIIFFNRQQISKQLKEDVEGSFDLEKLLDSKLGIQATILYSLTVAP